jgi:membrane-associated phospholipid phosphatase
MIFLVLSSLGSVAELVLQPWLSDTSAALICFLQKADHKLIELIFLALDPILAGCFIFVSFLLYCCKNKYLGGMGIIIGLLAVCMASFLKLCYAHPRPLYAYMEVRAIKCSKDFGFPSGHALSTGATVFFLAYHWFKDCYHMPLKIAAVSGSLLLVALDRLYLGVHFYFQVVQGLLYAGLLASIFVHPTVSHLMKKILNSKEHLAFFHAVGMIFLILSTMVFNYREPEIGQDWVQIYATKCESSFTVEYASFKNFNECTVMGAVLGFALGYYLTRKLPLAQLNFQSIIVAIAVGGLISGSLLGIAKVLDSVLIAPLVVMNNFVARYAVGLAVGYYVPVVLHRVTSEDKQLIAGKNIKY